MSYQPPQGPPGPPQPPQPPQWPQSPPQQPQPPAWGQSGYQPPPSKPKPPLYRRPWFIILGVLVLLFVVVPLLAGSPDEEPTTDQAQETTPATVDETRAPAEETPEAAGTGTPVRDGKFEFTVNRVECGKSRVGTADFGQTAQGQFCFVYMKVENIGREAQTLDGSAQYLYAGGGKRYDADTEAAIYLDDSKTFLEDINPGNAVDGIVVFDVPKSAKPERLELHDSLFSGGVTVEL